jgi:hypothetical protein
MRRDGRHDLDGAGAGADDADALAGEVVVVVPAGGVEEFALEAFEALDVGQGGIDEAADAGDDDTGGEGIAVLVVSVQVPVGFVEARADDFGVEPEA